MQPHWNEPQPLGEAQRTGLMQVNAQRAAQREHAVRQQIAQQQAALQARQAKPGVLAHAADFFSGGSMFGGVLGVLAGGALGYLAGSYMTKAKYKTAITERFLEGKNPEDEDDFDEDEDEDLELEEDVYGGDPTEAEEEEVEELLASSEEKA